MLDLAKFGSEIVWKNIKHETKILDDTELNNEKSFHRRSQIGIFLVKDTSEINKCLIGSKMRKRLPSDLVFSWGKLVNSDSLSLYIIKENSIEKELSEVNITSISTALRERSSHSEYDDRNNSGNSDSELYYEILFTFNSIGAEKLHEFTRRNVGLDIVIKLKGTVFFAPQVSVPIDGGEASISTPSKQDLIKFYMLILFQDIDGLTKVNKFEIR